MADIKYFVVDKILVDVEKYHKFCKEKYNFISLKDVELFISWRAKVPKGNEVIQIPDGNKLYIPDRNSWY